MRSAAAAALALAWTAASCANGQPYTMVHYGLNGDVSADSGGLEGGYIGRNDELICMAGLGGTLGGDGEIDGVDVDDESEVYAGLGLGIEPGLLLFATGGLWFRDFEDDDPDATSSRDTLVSGGLHLRAFVGRYVLSVGVHTERGLVLGFGGELGVFEPVRGD